jgi:hypothetical protein
MIHLKDFLLFVKLLLIDFQIQKDIFDFLELIVQSKNNENS